MNDQSTTVKEKYNKGVKTKNIASECTVPASCEVNQRNPRTKPISKSTSTALPW